MPTAPLPFVPLKPATKRCISYGPGVSDRRAPKLAVLKGFGHYEVYGGDAFRKVMEETLVWYGTHLSAR